MSGQFQSNIPEWQERQTSGDKQLHQRRRVDMAKKPQEVTKKSDAAISWILAAMWLGGLILVRILHEDIPLTMLLIGTVFFILLIPAMKEITRNLDRFFTNHSWR